MLTYFAERGLRRFGHDCKGAQLVVEDFERVSGLHADREEPFVEADAADAQSVAKLETH